MLRCPACGEPLLDPISDHCPQCSFDLRSEVVTGDDVSPFSGAYAFGRPGWWSMVRWVWFAGSTRLKHLALMRASSASRGFVRINFVLLSFFLGITEWSRAGWSWTGDRASRERDAQVSPAGEGWLHVAAAPDPLPANWAIETPTELWWNPARAVIAVVVASLTAMILLWVWSALMRSGATLAHRANLRRQGRMTAAIHYGTAWVVPLWIAAFVFSLRPVSYVTGTARWAVRPPVEFFVIAAGLLAGFGSVMWWFWLVRLGATAPPGSRRRVVMFFATGTPIITALLAIGWWIGVPLICGPIFQAMGLGES
jgi:hypothetical protein